MGPLTAIAGVAVGLVVACLIVGVPLALPVLIIGLALAVGLPMIAILRLSPSYRREVEAQKAAPAPTPPPVDPAFKHGTHTGSHAGVRFVYTVSGPDTEDPGAACVTIRVKAPGEFAVERQGVGTDLAHLFRMGGGFKTGDAALDQQYHFSGTTEAYVREVFADPANLDALRAVLAAGWTSVTKDDIVLTVGRQNGGYLSAAELHKLVETLTAFRLPKTVAGADDRLRGRRALDLVRLVALCIAIVGYTGIYATNILVEGGGDFARRSFPITVVILGALFIAAYSLLKGRSMAGAAMVELSIYVPFITVALIGILMLANQHFDRAEAHNVEVKLFTASKQGTSHYYVRFESWRGPGHEEYAVDQATHGLARPLTGQRWNLRLRQGWLGYPWIETMAPVGQR